jgi:hypothetical protein
MKYRKLPVIIEAELWDGKGINLIREMMGNKPINVEGDKLLINTLEGIMAASKGDYIIKGVNGEFYPCKPDIFEKTYEKVV